MLRLFQHTFPTLICPEEGILSANQAVKIMLSLDFLSGKLLMQCEAGSTTASDLEIDEKSRLVL